MPSQSEQLLAAAAVVAIVVGVMLYNRMAAARKPMPSALGADAARASSPAGAAQSAGWVGRYVQHDGDIVGRVVGVDGNRVFVQKGAKVLGVPRAIVREQGLDLGLTQALDEAKAAEDGASWQA